MQTTTDDRIPAFSPAARRLLSLVPAQGEPPHTALKEIAAGIGAMSDYELNALLIAIGEAVRAARQAARDRRSSAGPPEYVHLDRLPSSA